MLHYYNEKRGGCGYVRQEIQFNVQEKLSDAWLNENVSGNGGNSLPHQGDGVNRLPLLP